MNEQEPGQGTTSPLPRDVAGVVSRLVTVVNMKRAAPGGANAPSRDELVATRRRLERRLLETLDSLVLNTKL